MSDLISVIIPVFNSEKTLRRCLDSIVRQVYKNLEIILVDDGSTDSSFMICQSYVQDDKRFVYIKKENGGVSSARNVGIEYSNGMYILFIDSDDYVEPLFVSHLFDAIKKDTGIVMACCGVIKEGEICSIFPEKQYTDIISKNQMISYLLLGSKTKGWVWNKIYQRELVKNEKFDERIPFLEDLEFNIRILNDADSNSSVSFINSYDYHYVISSSSSSHINTKRIVGIVQFQNALNYLPTSIEKNYRLTKNALNQIEMMIADKQYEYWHEAVKTIRVNSFKCCKLLSLKQTIKCIIVSLNGALYKIVYSYILKCNKSKDF